MYSHTRTKMSHFGQRKRVFFQTGDLLKEIKFTWRFVFTRQEKRPLSTGGCLIEMITGTGLTVLYILFVLMILCL